MTSRSRGVSKKSDKAKSPPHSERSLDSRATGGSWPAPETLDQLCVDVISLRMDIDHEVPHLLLMTFMDQILLSTVVTPRHVRAPPPPHPAPPLARGSMYYNPGDQEKMCLFADQPLIVQIRPMRHSEVFAAPSIAFLDKAGSREVSAGNVDISPLFTGENSLNFAIRMQPTVPQNILEQKSWLNLPLLNVLITVVRHPDNAVHHQQLERANSLKIGLAGVYNLVVPYDEEWTYVAASRVPMANDQNNSIALFEQGTSIAKMPKCFRSTCHREHWESMRSRDCVVSEADHKFITRLDDIEHQPDINLTHVYSRSPNTIVWASFRRALLLGGGEAWLRSHLMQPWPLELHLLSGEAGYSFMGFIDATRLLYPGVTSVRVAVPLDWLEPEQLLKTTGFEHQLSPARCAKRGYAPPLKNSSNPLAQRVTKDEGPSTLSVGSTQASRRTASPSTPSQLQLFTGADGGVAFALLELTLQSPLVQLQRPRHIPDAEIDKMLSDVVKQGTARACTGRGQSETEWAELMNLAALALKQTPNYGITDYCVFNRQFVETRTRVEMAASLEQQAAIVINNSFDLPRFLETDETYDELLKLGHACLAYAACEAALGTEAEGSSLLRAARQARQMQDVQHAQDLYLELIMSQKKSADLWRELATCLAEVDAGWAEVCLKKSLALNPRHPLTLICLGCLVFDKCPVEAEVFFRTVLYLYPQWLTGCAIVQAYYLKLQYYDLADTIQIYAKKTRADQEQIQLNYPRSWSHELGDWWEAPLLLPGMSGHLDAADLLLRLRCLKMAEVCLSAALSESGESTGYYQMLALSRRLRGDHDGAICFLRRAIDKFGEASYLRALEAECLHQLGRSKESMEAFVKAGSCLGHYSLLLSMPCREAQRQRPLLVDLLRRQPSAYSWMALADNWLTTKEACPGSARAGAAPERVQCACACALQALRCDRRARAAWLTLARYVTPPARQRYCKYMANLLSPATAPARDSYDPRDACRALPECRCALDEDARVA